MDFFTIVARINKGKLDIYPKFIIKSPSRDLMIRGGDFYAVWCEDRGLWSTSEQDAIDIIDDALREYVEQNKEKFDSVPHVKYMSDAESGMIDVWHKYCQKQMRDSFHTLDETILWSNSKVNKGDYASKRLGYPLEAGDYSAWDRLVGVLYEPEERHKIEWAIGSIVTGASKKLQKFLVFYGEAGTGKSTILNVIQELFAGYFSVFDAKALGSSNAAFALEPFKNNPLVAIQHDGDLSRIEDNTRLNSLVSHELMSVNNKFEKLYSTRFKCFLFMGTNKPVKITDAKSGLLRRLIDVTPSGNKVGRHEYNQLVEQIGFELGAIAKHCEEVFLEDPQAYDDYVPISMMGESNDFYNFMEDNFFIFKDQDGTSLKAAWEMYKTFCEDAKLGYPLSKTRFKSELKNYFKDFEERGADKDGTRVRNYYSGFKTEKFDSIDISEMKNKDMPSWIELKEQKSIFDKEMSECPAQYANEEDKPQKAWDNVTTKLSDIDTSKVHYVRVPEDHIVIDFDLTNENGEKDRDMNIEAASKWPKTYCELSKSGKALHLHYLYTGGDPKELSSVYAPNIEVKVFSGKQSLRRRLSLCNDISIATINSGLPFKEKKKGASMVNFENVKDEQELTKTIVRRITKALNKEVHASTAQNINFIEKVLEDAYATGIDYDVSDLKMAAFIFASKSTNQSELCKKKVMNMKWRSAEREAENVITQVKKEPRLVIFDVETLKNLFLVCWKFYGKGKTVFRWFNPSPQQIEELFGYDLIGFNNKHYDNHMCYERLLGSNNQKLYEYNKAIINTPKGQKGPHHPEAWNASYTDIYEFAATKQSLKKWEIELEKNGYDISHKELVLNWDEEVPESKWNVVADYCVNDVLATESLFDYLQADFKARVILAKLADRTPNDSTNSLTTRIVFGNEKNPQKDFNYRNMGDTSKIDPVMTKDILRDYFGEDAEGFDEYTSFDSQGRPIFPGYSFDESTRTSTYRGEVVGEGGYVYAEYNVYVRVGLDDVASMHPSSIEAENLFGPYTKNFSAIKQLRIYIKHHEFDNAKNLLNDLLHNLYDSEKAKSILNDVEEYFTEEQADDLAYALKIAINAVYGQTAATYPCEFKDPRNIDNLVAKRGALFMVNLKHEVQKRGFTVAHIKTDSIKIPNADNDILEFVDKYGRMYGYTFEHEATYEKMCLVNDAVYIAQYTKPDICERLYGYVPGDNKKHFKKHDHPWTATGTQFQVPFVFKSLFSHEPIEFYDMCETKEVKKGTIYIDMNSSLPDVSAQEKELKKLKEKFEKGLISDTTYEPEAARLEEEIAKGHEYVFVGRVGLFCPIKLGHGGGELMCYNNGKYNAVTGTKKENNNCDWLEADVVKQLHKEDDIELGYYRRLCDEAKEAVAQYCDFDWFVSDEIDIQSESDDDFMNVPIGTDDEIPWPLEEQ